MRRVGSNPQDARRSRLNRPRRPSVNAVLAEFCDRFQDDLDLRAKFIATGGQDAMDVLVDPWLFRVSDQSCEILSASCATAWNGPHGFQQPRNAPAATSCPDAACPRRLSRRGRELATHCAPARCRVEVSQRETATHFFDLSVARDEWQNAQERCLIRGMLRDRRRMSRGGGLPLLAHRSAARTHA